LKQGLLESSFLRSDAGSILVVLHRATNSNRCAVFVPPFAEEMNKCRSQITATAHALVASGYSALVVDLYGTGDSEGDFNEATWSRWTQDIEAAVNWATEEGLVVDALIATRLGCLLAVESFAKANLSVSKTVFWQPVESGERYMSRFLRLGVSASMMKSGSVHTIDEFRQRLGAGEVLEIAGYPLSEVLSSEIDRARLSEFIGPFLGELKILEVGRSVSSGLSLESSSIESAANGRGLPARSLQIRGEHFWVSTEVVVNAELCRASVQFIVGDT